MVGIDIGGTKLLACSLDGEGRTTLNRLSSGESFKLKELIAITQDCLAALDERGDTCDAVGLGFPGLTDSTQGLVHSSVILGAWQSVRLADRLSEELGVACFVDNDVNNAARAELKRRPGCQDMLFITVGTGIGGALVLEGRIWTGQRGLAGEIGHMRLDRNGPLCPCGRRGCVGAIASGLAIERRLGAAPGSLPEIVRAAGGLRRQVKEAVMESAEALGVAIANTLNLLDLPLVVIGGGIAELGPFYVAAVEEAAKHETFPEIADGCRIEAARAGYEAGAVGAALLARELSACV